MGGILTPPTRCPSTSDFGSARSLHDHVPPRSLTFMDDKATENEQRRYAIFKALEKKTPRMTSSQETFENIQSLCASPNTSQSQDNLNNIKGFLSSPEALCGLGLEKQVLLRRKLAAAEMSEDVMSRRRLIYQDPIVPLLPLRELNLPCVR